MHAQSLRCVRLLQPYGLQSAMRLCPWDFLDKNTGASCYFHLQGIFLTQGSNHISYVSYMGRQVVFCLWMLETGVGAGRKITVLKTSRLLGSYSDDKESAWNVGDPGSIPGSGGSPGEGNGNPLQFSRLENSIDRLAWRATVHGVAKSQTQLSD